MNIYKVLKINQKIKSHRIKFLGLWFLSVFNKRYLSIQLDPVIACNLKCTMCYFSDPSFARSKEKGQLSLEKLENISNSFFKNALRLQIGCGAEPTLYKNINAIILEAKSKKVPHISMVTNGNLLKKEDLVTYVQSGLNELILSLHGVYASTYESFMVNGKYEKFIEVLEWVKFIKEEYPTFTLRINYTINKDNFDELFQFFDVFREYSIDIIQLRPIDKIGESAYQNFSLKSIESSYKDLYKYFITHTSNRKIHLIAPSSLNRNEEVTYKVTSSNDSSYLLPYTYCYISPQSAWKQDFDLDNQTFNDWKKQTKWNTQLIKNIFKSRVALNVTQRNMVNYEVNLN